MLRGEIKEYTRKMRLQTYLCFHTICISQYRTYDEGFWERDCSLLRDTYRLSGRPSKIEKGLGQKYSQAIMEVFEVVQWPV